MAYVDKLFGIFQRLHIALTSESQPDGVAPNLPIANLLIWSGPAETRDIDNFERGAGQNVFGPHQSIALDAVRRLDQAALAQARVVSDSTANVENARDTLSRALPGRSRRPGSILADGPMATRS